MPQAYVGAWKAIQNDKAERDARFIWIPSHGKKRGELRLPAHLQEEEGRAMNDIADGLADAASDRHSVWRMPEAQALLQAERWAQRDLAAQLQAVRSFNARNPRPEWPGRRIRLAAGIRRAAAAAAKMAARPRPAAPSPGVHGIRGAGAPAPKRRPKRPARPAAAVPDAAPAALNADNLAEHNRHAAKRPRRSSTQHATVASAPNAPDDTARPPGLPEPVPAAVLAAMPVLPPPPLWPHLPATAQRPAAPRPPPAHAGPAPKRHRVS